MFQAPLYLFKIVCFYASFENVKVQIYDKRLRLLTFLEFYRYSRKEWLRLKEMYKMLQRGETKSLKMEIKQDSHLNSEYQKNRCTNEDAASSKSLTIPIVSGTILQVNALDANGMLTKQTVKVNI